ncbi:class I SAM-dependent methyltransferase [Natrialbaceae archaeon GCM10025896]
MREAFTEQAEAYARNSSITDSERIDRLVTVSGAGPRSRVLEVATGPGHVAFGFADVCEDVVGIDLTKAPLSIAAEQKRNRSVDNVEFLQGDAESVPCSDNSFDIVVCRFALHHLENPSDVLQQMTRVCRPGGTIAVEDLVVSEHTRRGNYQNEFERLRDPSHVRALPISDLLRTVAEQGIEVEDVRSGALIPEVETWLSNAETPESRAKTVREMIRKDEERDLSGTRPLRRDGDLYFVQRTATIVGRVLENTPETPNS